MMRYMLGGCLALVGLATPLAAVRPKVGEPAPDFAVTLDDRTQVRLTDLRGQVVVLNFWATWCGPCKRELPMLNDVLRLRGDAGLKILAVTTEDSVSHRQLEPLARVLAIPLVRGIRGPYAPLDAVPTNFIIDRKGVLRYAKAAALTLDDVNQIIIPLLQEQ